MKTFFTVLAVLLLSFQPARAADYPPLKTSEDLLAACPWYVNSFPYLFYKLTYYQIQVFYRVNEDWHGCAVSRLMEQNKISDAEIDVAANNLFRTPNYSWSFYFWTSLLENRHDPEGAYMMALTLSNKEDNLFNPEKAKHLFRIYLLTRFDHLCVQEHPDAWKYFQKMNDPDPNSIYSGERTWFLTLCKKRSTELFKLAKGYLQKDNPYYSPLIAYALLKYLYEERSYKPAEQLYVQAKMKQKNKN